MVSSERKKSIELILASEIYNLTGETAPTYEPADYLFEHMIQYNEKNLIITPIYSNDLYKSLKEDLQKFKADLILSQSSPEDAAKLSTSFFNTIHIKIKSRQIEREKQYSHWRESIDRIIMEFETTNNVKIHKGAHYYWTGENLLTLNYVDRGFFYIFNAYEEDKRLIDICQSMNPKTTLKLEDLPSAKFRKILVDTQDPLFSYINTLNDVWISQLKTYRINFPGILDEKWFRQHFIEDNSFSDISLNFLYILAQIKELREFQVYNPSENIIYSSILINQFLWFGRIIENLLRQIGKNQLNLLKGSPNYQAELKNWKKANLQGYINTLIDKVTLQNSPPIILPLYLQEIKQLISLRNKYFEFNDIDPNNPSPTVIKLENIVKFKIPRITTKESIILSAIAPLRNFPGHWVSSININHLSTAIYQFLFAQLFLVMDICMDLSLV